MLLARGGMDEAKLVCMQAQTAQAVVGSTVFLVADDGMAKILGMHADLVLAARLQMEVHQRIVLVADQHLVMGHGIFSAIVGGA